MGPLHEVGNVEPEQVPPELSGILQSVRLEWSGIFVSHVWLDLEVTVTDEGGVARVTFLFKDTGSSHPGLDEGNDVYGTTFEVDFCGDYIAGYEVEAAAYDFAGNTMKKTAGGGLSHVLDRGRFPIVP